jgi:hypothetical protein
MTDRTSEILYRGDLKKIDDKIGELIALIENMGIDQNDIDHCTKHLINLYDDLESITGVEI